MRNAANVLVHTTAIASAKISKNLGKRRKLRKRSASFFAMPISSHPLAHWFAKPMPFYLPHSASYIRKLYIGIANCQCKFPACCAVFSCQDSLHIAMHPPQNFSPFGQRKKRPTLAIHRKTPGRAKRASQGRAKSRKFQSTSGALVNWSGFGVIQGTRVGSGVASGSAK